MEKLTALSGLFGISLDELVLGKVPVTTKLDQLSAKVMSSENKRKAKMGAKIGLIAAAVILAVDAVSMVVYFLLWGFPK